MIVPARFNGPPRSAHGGWVAGALARHVRPGLAVQVSLVASPPLDTELEVATTDDGVELRHGDRTLLSAVATDEITVPVPAVEPEEAAAARARLLVFPAHPFVSCFVCGTARPDGLQVYPGPVAADWTQVATTFVTTEFAAAPELPWAVLDCPTGWAAWFATRPALLASYTVRVVDEIEPGEPCVLVGQDDGPRGTSGRARGSRSAFYGADGRLIAHADAVWVAPKPL